jgi:hypothetical protein
MEIERHLPLVKLRPRAEQVLVGNCFTRDGSRVGNFLFMRVEIIKQIRWESKVEGRTVPVVNLQTGAVYCIPADEPITLVDAKTFYAPKES